MAGSLKQLVQDAESEQAREAVAEIRRAFCAKLKAKLLRPPRRRSSTLESTYSLLLRSGHGS